MRILVTGATGLVGSAVTTFLEQQGHEVFPLVRSKEPVDGQAWWDPAAGECVLGAARPIEAVIHLAGENIASGRWTDEKKKRIRDSRVNGTKLLSEALASLPEQPQVFISSSAIGYYGNRGEEPLTERSSPGDSWLSQVCQDWEAATEPASDTGIRTINLRTGIVLSKEGGMLKRMWLPFKMGVGGIVGSGEQMMSWIDIRDLVQVIHHILFDEEISGPVNGTAPHPVSNREFTKTFGKVIRRPTIFPMPETIVRWVFGELGDELMLKGAMVLPRVLEQSSFEFQHPGLEESLKTL